MGAYRSHPLPPGPIHRSTSTADFESPSSCLQAGEQLLRKAIAYADRTPGFPRALPGFPVDMVGAYRSMGCEAYGRRERGGGGGAMFSHDGCGKRLWSSTSVRVEYQRLLPAYSMIWGPGWSWNGCGSLPCSPRCCIRCYVCQRMELLMMLVMALSARKAYFECVKVARRTIAGEQALDHS